MASPTRWTWVWVSSGSWWWTGKPGVLQSMGSKRVGHDWANELSTWLSYNLILYLLTTFIQFRLPPPFSSSNHKSDLFFYTFVVWSLFLYICFFAFYISLRLYSFVFFCLIYFTYHNVFTVHPCCHKEEDVLIFCGWIIYICVCTTISLSIHALTSAYST